MRARSAILSLHFYLWVLNSWKVQAGEGCRQRPLSARINGGKTLASVPVSCLFPLDGAQGVRYARDQINLGAALLYLFAFWSQPCNGIINYPQTANDGILWQPVCFGMDIEYIHRLDWTRPDWTRKVLMKIMAVLENSSCLGILQGTVFGSR